MFVTGMERMTGFAKRGPQDAPRKRVTDSAKAAVDGGAHGPQAGVRDRRRRSRVTGAAAQSVVAAMYAATGPSAADRARMAQAAMGQPPRMTPAQVDAELAARAQYRAWGFDRRKADVPRNADVEDAIILE